jgi:hypothetical protein
MSRVDFSAIAVALPGGVNHWASSVNRAAISWGSRLANAFHVAATARLLSSTLIT